MNTPHSNRRQFLRQAALCLPFAAVPHAAFGATETNPPNWTIGCLNRPWVKWSADEMLDGVKAAGYRVVGLQTPTSGDPFVASVAKPEYLETLKEKIAVRGLTAIQGRLQTKDAATYEEAVADIRQQIENAKTLGLPTLINTGSGKPERYEAWYKLMAYGAEYAADNGIQLVIKPHGAVSATAADILVCLEKINHPNISVWYDAGNIIYYTGLDPLQELEPIISHVTAFTAKDCAAKGTDVMIQLGTGKVDFAAIFRRLKKANFNGPIMLETSVLTEVAAETTANAKANRLYLESVLADL